MSERPPEDLRELVSPGRRGESGELGALERRGGGGGELGLVEAEPRSAGERRDPGRQAVRVGAERRRQLGDRLRLARTIAASECGSTAALVTECDVPHTRTTVWQRTW